MTLQLAGSAWGWVALGLGVLFLVFRWFIDSKRHMPRLIWPAYLAELSALLLLGTLVLQPVWERQSYRFSKPEFWLAVDQSYSFEAGKTLGLEGTVVREYEAWKGALEGAGFRIRTFAVTGSAGEVESIGDLQQGLDRSWSSLQGLNDAIILAGQSVTGVLYLGDGRERIPQGRHGGPVSFSIPFFFTGFNLASIAEIQPEGFEWISQTESMDGPLRGHLRWRGLGSVLDSGQACLLVEGRKLGCWPLAIGGLPNDGGLRTDTLEVPRHIALSLASAKRVAWLLHPIPESGRPHNDTLAVNPPHRDIRPALIWPGTIPSLDVTAIIRVLDSDSIQVRFRSPKEAGERFLVAEYAPVSGPASEGKSRRADLWLQVPNAGRHSPLFAGPGPGWQMKTFSAMAKLGYAGESRRFLPSALAVLGDLSETPLELPAAQSFSPCFLNAVEGDQAGCVVGWIPDSGTVAGGRFYWALPAVWNSLFSETGNHVLERRLKQMGSGIIQWMSQTRLVDSSGTKPPDQDAKGMELRRLGQDREWLTEVATASGGKALPLGIGHVQDTVTLKELGLLAAKHEVGVPETNRIPFQLTLLVFLLIVCLLGASWYWRKRFHLA